jgi:hypothetical protein
MFFVSILALRREFAEKMALDHASTDDAFEGPSSSAGDELFTVAEMLPE